MDALCRHLGILQVGGLWPSIPFNSSVFHVGFQKKDIVLGNFLFNGIFEYL